jgi:predicted ribosome quality control (RQC) complex YloA/Tae2 family protein
MTQEDLGACLAEDQDKNIAKVIAIALGLGGTYAKEACLRAGLDEKMSAGLLTEENIKALWTAIRGLLTEKKDAQIVYDGDNIKDITPFSLVLYKEYTHETKASYSKALDSVFAQHLHEKRKEQRTSGKQKKITELEKVLKSQEAQREQLKRSIEENTHIAETLYQQYGDVVEKLTQTKRLAKEKRGDELKEALKNIGVLGIDTKEKKMRVDI